MNLEKLKKLIAKVHTAKGQMAIEDASYDFRKAANPQAILALIELCQMQHEALKDVADLGRHHEQADQYKTENAIAAYENFEKEST